MAVPSFDAATALGTVTATSLTTSHTTGVGQSRYALVGVVSGLGTDVVTGVTYGGIAMTQVSKIIGGTGGSARTIYLYSLMAPLSGANNVVITNSGSELTGGLIATYADCRQTATPENFSQTLAASGASLSCSITTLTDQAYAISFVKNDIDVSIVAGAGTTVRVRETGVGSALGDKNSNITPPAATSILFGPQSGGTLWSAINVSLAPPAVTGGMFMVF